MGRKFTDDEDSVQDILINDLEKSKELFNSLSILVNEDNIKRDISKSINSLSALIQYIVEANNEDLIELLEKYQENKNNS